MMAFPTIIGTPGGRSVGHGSWSTVTEDGRYRTGEAQPGDIVIVGLIGEPLALAGWTATPDRRWLWRVVTEPGVQPWPGWEYKLER